MAKLTLNTGDTYKGGRLTEGIVVKGKNVTIEDTVVECDGIALYSTRNCSGLTVRNCTFVSRKNNAVKIVADNVKVDVKKPETLIKNLLFEDCKFVFSDMGIEIQNHKTVVPKIDGVTIRGCEFDGSGGTGKRYGISLSGYSDGALIERCKTENCVKGVELAGFSYVDIKYCDISGSKYSVISSNKRPMINVGVRSCELNGRVELCNTLDSEVTCNHIACSEVRFKKCKNIRFAGNIETSKGYYSVMLDNSSDCMIEDNELTQNGNNRAVVRCYQSGATGNTIRRNKMVRKKKTGKLFDEVDGAKGNIYIK